MNSRDENSANDRGSAAPESQARAGNASVGKEPFEQWLDSKLRTVYGSVLDEAIPDDLINLLKERLDKKTD